MFASASATNGESGFSPNLVMPSHGMRNLMQQSVLNTLRRRFYVVHEMAGDADLFFLVLANTAPALGIGTIHLGALLDALYIEGSNVGISHQLQTKLHGLHASPCE